MEREINNAGSQLKLSCHYINIFQNKYKDGVVISKDNFVLDGNGMTIDASGNSRILHITGNNVVIKNVHFTSGNHNQVGAGVYFEKSGTLEGCSFSDCQGTRGAAAYFGGNAVIKNCDFNNNGASECGTVYLKETATIEKTQFYNNYAQYGGALYFLHFGNVKGCTFLKNHATGHSGAITFNSYGGSVSDCDFRSNSAPKYGALCSIGIVTIDNCEFINNEADEYGIIYTTAYATITNSNFRSNTVKRGGSLYIESAGELDNCTFYQNENAEGSVYFYREGLIKNSIFSNNGADKGGAVYFNEKGTVYNTTFEFNHAQYGGAVYFNGEGIVNQSSFFNQSQNANSGGAIYFNSKGTVDNSVFINNTASNGGAIYFNNKGTVDNSVFINNTASNGGAIYFNDEETVDNSVFISNTAHFGGAIYFNNKGTVDNSLFINNTEYNGGAIYFNDEGTVDNSVFVSNTASNGGAIYFNNKGTVDNSVFVSNTAHFGGVIYFNNEGIVNSSEFNNNHAYQFGGALYFFKNGQIINSQFNNNTAIMGGANFFNDQGTVNSSKFYNNSATLGGANVFNIKGIVNNSLFDNNCAVDMGGANYFIDSENLYNCTFNNNKADLGGANYINREGYIINSTFNNNSASNGGAIYSRQSYMNSCNFYNNTAESNGGAVYLETEGDIVDSNFNNNYAKLQAGAVYCYINASVINSTFTGNSALNGGAIYFNNYGQISDSSFKGNHAEIAGGAVTFIREGNVLASNFTDNSADTYGGAIIFLAKEIESSEVSNSNFVNNSASEGGAIHAYQLTLKNSNFTKNHVKTHGGALYVNSDANIDYSLFYENEAKSGGAIYIDSLGEGLLDISNSGFSNNIASDETNHICLKNNAMINLVNVTPEDIGPFKIISFDVSVQNSTYESEVKIIAKASVNEPLNEGNVSLTVNGTKYTAKMENGIAVISISGLDVGIYETNVTYDGGMVYNKPTKAIKFKVAMENANITLNYLKPGYYGYGEVIIQYIVIANTPVQNGTLSITFNNETHYAIYSNGSARFNLTGLNAGNYTGIVTFDGGINYHAEPVQVNFTVYKSTTSMNVTVDEITHGQTLIIMAKLTSYQDLPINEGNVSIVVGDVLYSAEVINGTATIFIENLDAGSYNSTITYNSNNYENSSEIVKFNVNKEETSIYIDVSDVEYGDDVIIGVYVFGNNTTISEGNISVIINNKSYSQKIRNGFARLTITDLEIGIYKSILKFSGEINYYPSAKNITFEVTPIHVDIDVNVNDITYGESAIINVNVTAQNKLLNTGNISVYINNRLYVINVSNGTATIEIPNCGAGVFNGNVGYDGGKNYTKPAVLVSFRVLKQTPQIIASAKTYVVNYGGVYSITLKDIKGNALSGQKVTFVLNGKTVANAVSDANGVVKITLTDKILKAAKTGNKALVIKFNGSSNYNGISKTVKITINKEKTKITAKNKKFKRSKKIKKYAIKLKNSKGKPIKKVKVTLKVKGKTYKAKTNKKGKAIFKIKKLTKKGKFTAKIKFKGNKYYKAVSKKVKIRLK